MNDEHTDARGHRILAAFRNGLSRQLVGDVHDAEVTSMDDRGRGNADPVHSTR